jgi:hypothetical protein
VNVQIQYYSLELFFFPFTKNVIKLSKFYYNGNNIYCGGFKYKKYFIHLYITNEQKKKKFLRHCVCVYIENYHQLGVQDLLYYIYLRILQGSIDIAYFYYTVHS